MAQWFCASAEYVAVSQWTASTSYSVGAIVRQLAVPAVGSERCFRCTSAGTSGSAEPTWTLTKGSVTSDNAIVWTEVTGNSTYNSFAGGWHAPLARLATALSWCAAGDTVYMAHDHAETQSSTAINLASPGSSANPVVILCVNTSSGTLATTASVTTTVNAALAMNFSGVAYAYGISFSFGASGGAAGAQFGNNVNVSWKLENCFIEMLATTGGVLYLGGGATGELCCISFVNTPISFGSANQSISLAQTRFWWRNTTNALGGAAVPTTLFGSSSTYASTAVLDGVDLSAAGSGKTLVGAVASSTLVNITNCLLGAGVTIAASPTFRGGAKTFVGISDSASTTCRQEIYDYPGTLTTDTTDIRSGGANDGTTPISWKVVTSANANWWDPFECFEIVKWCVATGSPITVSIAIMGNATLTNADIWPDVEYLGNASYPIASLASGGTANLLATGSAWPADSVSSWTTSGVTGPVQQTISATFTPQLVGYVRVKVKVARPNQTVRIDPLLQGF